MNRTELQRLSDERIEDAQTLLAASRWAGAYYLAGYAVECALKACVMAYIERTGVIFEDKKYAEKCWTHDIDILVKLAELTDQLDVAKAANPHLKSNWTLVKEWSEVDRYRFATQQRAEKLLDAITNHSSGVLTWIKKYW